MIDKTIIMHISDLHFGIEKKKPTVRDYREKVLTTFKRDFLDKITRDPGLSPDILVVSGDIAYEGSSENYKEAEDFFDWILNIQDKKIARENVILCFGNHDVYASPYMKAKGATLSAYDHRLKKLVHRPESNLGFDDYYNFELDINERYHRFKNIESFCKKMNFVALTSDPNRTYQYAYGSRKKVHGIDFICLNTEWDFWGNEDKNAEGRLRIGSNLYLEATASFNGKKLFDLDTPPRFVIYHRPLEYLHMQEREIPRLSVADRIVGSMIFRENDVSLNGHIHSSNIRINGTHTQITAGSIHTNDKWEFTCNMIFVPKTLTEGLNECSVLLYKYNSEFSLWRLDSFEKSKIFSIVRSQKYKQIVDFVIKFREWLENREKNVRKQLKNELDLLSNEIPIFITLLGEAGLKEIHKELEGKKLAMFQYKYTGKDDNPEPSGGGGGVTKNDEKVKGLNLGPQTISGEGYFPSRLTIKE